MTKQAPPPQSMTPLDTLLQVDLAPRIDHQAESGCLVLIPAQTGIGKTHAIKQLMLAEMMKAITENRPGQPIFYITNSVDNVRQTFLELQQLVTKTTHYGTVKLTAKQRKALEEKIVYLPSQESQLLETPPEIVEHIMQLFELQRDKQLSKAWQEVKKDQRFIQENPNIKSRLQERLTEQASTTYRMLINRIQSRQRSADPLNLSNKDMQLIDQLIPGDRLYRQEAHIAFMTTQKFLSGYQTSRYRIHPLQNAGKALLLIDEFDRQNEEILQVMVRKKSIDLIEFTCTLHDKLTEHQLENSTRYAGIEEVLEPLRQELVKLVERWNLQYAFNTEGGSLDNESIRLFSDRTITHVHSLIHRLRLTTDPELRKNIIIAEEFPNPTTAEADNRQMSRFVNEADTIFRGFIWSMRKAVWQYLQNNSNTIAADQRRATPQEAVHSILRHFHLQELSHIVLTAFDNQLSFSGRRPQSASANNRAASRAYHDNGFKLTDIRRNESTTDTVSCYYSGLQLTPSGLLARMVESGIKIVGISATATTETVIKNFDLRYLKTRLGEQFLELNSQQKASIGQWYRSRRQYEKSGIVLSAEFINAEQEQLRKALEDYNEAPIHKPIAAIKKLFNSTDDNEFNLIRSGKLLSVLRRFMQTEHNRYLLILLNMVVSKEKQPEFIRFLNDYLQRQSAVTGYRYKLFCGLNAEAMRQGKFAEVQQHLSTTTDKVIVLSTYASMGEGKNPDYLVTNPDDQKHLLWVGDGTPPETIHTDIDSLYLEKPTNQLLSDQDDFQANQLLLCHQIMALQEMGAMSVQESRRWLKGVLKGNSDKDNLAVYYKTTDYQWLLCKIIEQAVGRTARTAFKRPVIRLYVDHELQRFLAADERPSDTLSHEYIALRSAAAAVETGLHTMIEQRSQQVLHNRAVNCTIDTLALIKELMQGFNGSAPSSAICSWENLRKQLLAQPTVAAAAKEYPKLYIEVPSTAGYRFFGQLETNQESLANELGMKFFDQASGNMWISEANSGLPQLMQNPIVRQYFEARGYATHWQENAFMLNPAAFFNLYKGALGEESIAAVLEHAGLIIKELPQEHYERCDFLAQRTANQTPVAIDAKHWQSPGDAPHHALKAKALAGDPHLQIQQWAYINLFGNLDDTCRYLDHDLRPCSQEHSPVIEVPGLINPENGDILLSNLTALIHWMGE